MGKIISIFVCAILSITLLITALLPSVISTSWGNRQVVAFINRAIPGHVSINKIDIGWVGPQRLEGVSLSDPDGTTVFTLDSLSAQTSIINALWHLSTSGNITFQGFNARLISDNKGNTNLMRALDRNCCGPEKLEDRAPVTVAIKNVHGALNLSESSTLFSFKMSGETEQGKLRGKLNIDAELRGISLKELVHLEGNLAESLHSNPNVEVKIHADVANFPVEILDQVVAVKTPQYSGLLTSLLGQDLNVTVNQKTTPNGLSLALAARSPTVTADVGLAITDVITLSKPAIVSFQLTPQLVHEFCEATDYKTCWNLSSPTMAHLEIPNFSMPLHMDSFDALTLASTLDIESADFTTDIKASHLSLRQLHATLIAEANAPTALLSLTAQGINNQQPLNVNITTTAPKSVLKEGMSVRTLKRMVIQGQVSGIPLTLLDQHLEMDGLLSEWLGAKGELAFSLKEEYGRALASLEFKSERLELPKFAVWIENEITLQQPAVAVLKLPPSAINKALKDVQPRVQSPVTAQLMVKSFSTPMASLPHVIAAPLSSMYKVDLNAELIVSPIQMIAIPALNTASVNDLALRLAASRHTHPELTATASLLPDGAGRLYDLIGKKGTLDADASFGINLDGKPTINVFNLRFVTDLGRIETSGEMRDGNRIILNSPAFASYTFTPAALRSLGITAENYSLTQGAPLRMTIETSLIPLTLADLPYLKLTGTMKVDDVEVVRRGRKDISQAILDKLTAQWNLDAGAGNFSLDFTGLTRLGENEGAGKLYGSLAFTHWMRNGRPDFNDANIVLNTTASHLPTQLVSSLSGGPDLAEIIGNALNVDLAVNGSFQPGTDGTVKLELSSDHLIGRATLLLGDTIKLKEGHPAVFQLQLTPQSYALIREQAQGGTSRNFVLAENTRATLTIESLNVPTGKPLIQSGLVGHFDLDRLVGLDVKNQKKLALSGIKGHISSQNIADHIDFTLSANGHDDGSSMLWNMSGALDKGFTIDGVLNRQDLSLNFDASLEAVSIPMLCEFSCVDPKTRNQIEALIGPLLNATVRAKLQRMNGPLYVALKGKNGSLTFDASINNGYLQLNQNLVAEVAVTPQLSTHVFNELLPVLSGMLSADHPIRLTIDRQGFSIPINDPSETTVSIGKATLDAGKVKFSGDSQLAKVLSLLTPSNTDQFNVWLTPAYVSLKQGFLRLERVDMLISENYPIAAWGDVDFNKERVNMIIALSGAAIDKAFGFSSVPASSFLQIPLRGRLDNPSLDKTKAAARLSALVAQSTGGPQGAVIGTVLDIASGGLTEPSPPQPTTNPLPWAALMKDKPSSEKKTLKPLDEVGKGASSLLKKIIPH